ncbi:hypothetical protein NDU88_004660 [Pleurodeles waltl]|uniref:Uncharacterized protein n=1 Tax=Pleurodeles waltl TaxID=8319 RepID=A0AAV7SJF2_PLEWA|nr:hypothetical protein NDU88_004660 [Pleurodeles waltl]
MAHAAATLPYLPVSRAPFRLSSSLGDWPGDPLSRVLLVQGGCRTQGAQETSSQTVQLDRRPAGTHTS